MSIVKRLMIMIICLSVTVVNGEDAKNKDEHHGHDHEKEKEEHSGKDGHDHDKHEKEDKHDDHAGHKEGDKHDKHEKDEHDHGGGKAIGKGKAVVDVDEKKGFKLSAEAIKTLKLKLQTVEGSEFKIEKSTLVTSKNLTGVYRFREGYFKLLPAKIIKEIGKEYQVQVEGVDFGDQIVIDGTGLLNVADIYSTDKSEYGHAH